MIPGRARLANLAARYPVRIFSLHSSLGLSRSHVSHKLDGCFQYRKSGLQGSLISSSFNLSPKDTQQSKEHRGGNSRNDERTLLQGRHGVRGFATKAARVPISESEPFLLGEASPYMEQMYTSWEKDPGSVHASWAAYFSNLSKGLPSSQAFSLPPRGEASPKVGTGSPYSSPAIPSSTAASVTGGKAQSDDSQSISSISDISRIIQLVRGYQLRGHEFAKIDPLGLPHILPYVTVARNGSRRVPIDYKSYGFTEADLDRSYDCRVIGVSGFLSVDRKPIIFRKLLERLEEVYCGHIGIEYMHIEDADICNYLRNQIERETEFQFDPDMRRRILVRTARAQLFENFCAAKFNTSKRFGVDGCETMIVAMKAITKKAVTMDVSSVVIGMPHRGRINVLMNVMHKPMQQMMSEFQGVTGFGHTDWGNTGDVKYHLGVEFDHFDIDAKRNIHMGVLANPSHLEAVDPLVVGQTRAQQHYSNDSDRSKVLPIMLHGDASFAGQGVVYETLQMSKLPDYTVGGTIHIIVNNQIGFTTNVLDQGSGRYCSDLAKCIEAPVFHVNGDDPEAVTRVAHIALAYRQQFHRDVFINLVGYRRLGHNELDMPKFTQPRMYNIIAKHPTVLESFSNKLISEGVVSESYVDNLKKNTLTFYDEQYQSSKSYKPTSRHPYLPQWSHMAHPDQICLPRLTGVSLDRLKDVGKAIASLPEGFTAHPTIAKTYKARLLAVESGDNIDFGFGEALAFATLIQDGFHIRLSGQDCQRGTFSHRHAVVHDQTTYATYNPIQTFANLQHFPHGFECVNSPLSEYAALGFEVGYALENPDTLAIWEAQFGDFANGAQIVIDQFIAAGETKWGCQCGVVMLLPHGYDGQGPEHSSARIERFLQLCDDREDVIHPESFDITKRSVIQKHNIQVVNCTTPANFFHVLRRQMHRGFRKPLIVISPKRMLKMRATYSRLEEIAEGTGFLRYIPNFNETEGERPSFYRTAEGELPIDESIQRLILCSGQIYYDLAAYREKHGMWHVGISRVEQISPFPFDKVVEDIRRHPNIRDVVWAQEEPMNAGPWGYVSKRIGTSLEHLSRPNGVTQAVYVGRDVSSAPAGGDTKVHQLELDAILKDAFDLYRRENSFTEKHTGLATRKEAEISSSEAGSSERELDSSQKAELVGQGGEAVASSEKSEELQR